jgi:hypothetical protein
MAEATAVGAASALASTAQQCVSCRLSVDQTQAYETDVEQGDPARLGHFRNVRNKPELSTTVLPSRSVQVTLATFWIVPVSTMKTPETGSKTNPSPSDTNSIMSALWPEFASKTVTDRTARRLTHIYRGGISEPFTVLSGAKNVTKQFFVVPNRRCHSTGGVQDSDVRPRVRPENRRRGRLYPAAWQRSADRWTA